MSGNSDFEQHRAESRCPACGKFLTKPLISIKNVSLSVGDYAKFRRGVTLKYGSQTMCRNCKKLRESLVEVSFDAPYGGTTID